jgi:hypothetical protein
MELEFPGFVLLLMMAIGLLAFGAGPHAVRERLDRMAGVNVAAHCADVAPSEASHFFGAPTPPVPCTVY